MIASAQYTCRVMMRRWRINCGDVYCKHTVTTVDRVVNRVIANNVQVIGPTNRSENSAFPVW
ncbi:hypothetical protein SMATCC274_10400 [Serratia marcescens]|nr:hypothetical protein SMATCC274_10400 [Serratia marcescens]